MHTGYIGATTAPPPAAALEFRATIRVLPPQDRYISSVRNSIHSRPWGGPVVCSYVEKCCIVKEGGTVDLEPCLTNTSRIDPTIAPAAVAVAVAAAAAAAVGRRKSKRTTRASSSSASDQQRPVPEVRIQFNLCNEPWLKYSMSVVADKGLEKHLFTSSRLKAGEVLYLESHTRRYELCFQGTILKRPATARPLPQETMLSTGIPQQPEYDEVLVLARFQGTTLKRPAIPWLQQGGRILIDERSREVDVFKWSCCKRPLPQETMLSSGTPLQPEYVEVLHEKLEWEDIEWSHTGVWVAGKEYHLARAHFLSPVPLNHEI